MQPSEDGDFRSDSPPMPSIPPPAPPAELLSEIESSLSSGMETLSLKGSKIQGPHCVALYDFEGSHPGDLKFKVCLLFIVCITQIIIQVL